MTSQLTQLLVMYTLPLRKWQEISIFESFYDDFIQIWRTDPTIMFQVYLLSNYIPPENSSSRYNDEAIIIEKFILHFLVTESGQDSDNFGMEVILIRLEGYIDRNVYLPT